MSPTHIWAGHNKPMGECPTASTASVRVLIRRSLMSCKEVPWPSGLGRMRELFVMPWPNESRASQLSDGSAKWRVSINEPPGLFVPPAYSRTIISVRSEHGYLSVFNRKDAVKVNLDILIEMQTSTTVASGESVMAVCLEGSGKYRAFGKRLYPLDHLDFLYLNPQKVKNRKLELNMEPDSKVVLIRFQDIT
ncbi:hypothetical protein ACFL31_02730 [Candidatus Margulisiibacteriota bacterium]